MSIGPLKAVVCSCAPLLVYIPLAVTGSLLIGNDFEPWKSWLAMAVGASFVMYSPLLKTFETKLARAVALLFGFVIWLVLLFFGTLLAAWFATGDSL